MQIFHNVCLMNCHDKLYKVHPLKFDLRKKNNRFFFFELIFNLLDVVFICRCPFIDEKKILKWIGHFLLKEKRKNDKKSNHHSENSAHIKSIHWVVFDMSMYTLSLSPSLSLFFLLLSFSFSIHRF